MSRAKAFAATNKKSMSLLESGFREAHRERAKYLIQPCDGL